ncbi:DUF2530 domain-containing protein [Agromyces sp. H3Y2-19a]|uniref:DUF2530 domain-containing protein n=1 Tax=Agromyces TaxID=33877 RepID=UPI0023B9DC8D|nr:DUF2530 domain-containing protein [Agromyces chromiiresistens]MDF0512806.1 DUF2530 domain-containing protein [Agromyces chromiiresistens]
MRLWLSESERRPDPAPARADARKALVAGTIGWIALLGACLAFGDWFEASGLGWLTAASVVGVALGLIGLGVVQTMRRRARQSPAGVSDSGA